MSAITVVLVRHGQTAWSDDRYMGREDVPLNDTGLAQADALVAVLATTPIDRLWCSPLARARQTIAPLAAARGLPVTIVDDLVEMHYGDYQGRYKRDHRLQLKEDHVRTPIAGGESLADVVTRADRTIDRLAAEVPPGATVVVVGHYRVGQFLFGRLLGHTLDQVVAGATYKPGNGTAYAVRCAAGAGGRLAVTGAAYVGAPGAGP